MHTSTSVSATTSSQQRSVRSALGASDGLGHPRIVHSLGSQPFTLTAALYESAQGAGLIQGNQPIRYTYAAEVFEDSGYPASTVVIAPATQDLYTGLDGGITGIATGTFQAQQGQRCDESPDYGKGYIVAHDPSVQGPPFALSAAPAIALFEVRIWGARSAVMSLVSDTDGQSAAPGRQFDKSLAVRVTDSWHSERATQGMQVRFRISSDGNAASWDRAGTNQGQVSISDDGREAIVLCQNGVAIAPRLVAGSQAGAVRIIATSDFSTSQVYFSLSIRAADGTGDAWSVTVDQGDFQDQVPGSNYVLPLSVKAYTKDGLAADAGTIVFQPQIAAARVMFGDALSVTADVNDGAAATTTPLQPDGNSTYGRSGYGTASVLAYPRSYTGDPGSDTSGRVARYSERVWRANTATMSNIAGDNQKANQGLDFSDRLVVAVKDELGNSVPNMLVTFEIKGPAWCAQFDQHDTEAPTVTFTPTKVLVRAGSDGRAKTPLIQAGTAGTCDFIVTASSTVTDSTQDVDFHLSVLPPLDHGDSCAVNEGDWQDQVIGQNFEMPLTVKVVDPNGAPVKDGNVVFEAVNAAITGQFNGQATATVAVEEGGAVSPLLTAVRKSTDSTPYVVFNVLAYTSDNTQHGAADGRTAVFKQRGWYAKSAVLTRIQGNNQSALPGELFSVPLIVAVQDGTAPVADILVTFTLDGSAKFVTGSQKSAYVSLSDTSAVVRTNSDGQATAPPVQAGDKASDVTITASVTVAAATLPFALKVLSPSTDAYYVSKQQGDMQDQVNQQPFVESLVVAVTTAQNTPAADGTSVTFLIVPGTGSARFANASGMSYTAKVSGGKAYVPSLVAVATTASFNYGEVQVIAYPTSSFQGDPKSDTSGRTAHFTERVWSGSYVSIAATQGQSQSTPMGQNFPLRPAVSVSNARVANSPLGQYLVTFTISPAGSATFALDDSAVEIVDGDEQTVVVRSNADGTATAPLVKAANAAGSVTITASGSASTTKPTFALTVKDTTTQARFVAVDKGDGQDIYMDASYPTPLSVSVTDAQGRPALTGQVTFKIFKNTIDGYFEVGGTRQNEASVDVVSGAAIAPLLVAGHAANSNSAYVVDVVAYPKTYTGGDPHADTSNQTAHFSERVWSANSSVTIKKTAGDSQSAIVGSYFARLQVQAVNGSTPVPGYLMTFAIITGSGAFDLTDNNRDVQLVSGTARSVVVRADASGNATAPRILAGDTPGEIQVSVMGNVTANPPDHFKLTVLDASTAPYFVQVAGGDLQDESVGYQFPIPLSVSVQDVHGRPCNTGTVTFRIAADDDTGATFAGSTPDHATVPVKNGVATAPLLSSANAYIAPWEYLVTKVIAYPDPFDPATDPPSRTAQFSERSWGPFSSIALLKTAGDGGQARPGEWFSDRLVTRANYDTEYLDGYLVKFTISTTTNTFDLDDPDPRVNIVSGDATSVLVRSDADGYATAPRILAGNTAAAFRVKAQGNIDNGATFGLTVVAPAQLSYGIVPGAPSLTMTAQDKRRMSFYLFDQDTRVAIAGQTVTLSLANHGTQVSFEQGNAGKTSVTCTTDSLGGVYQDVYANAGSGNATLTASNTNVGQGCSVNVKVGS